MTAVWNTILFWETDTKVGQRTEEQCMSVTALEVTSVFKDVRKRNTPSNNYMSQEMQGIWPMLLLFFFLQR